MRIIKLDSSTFTAEPQVVDATDKTIKSFNPGLKYWGAIDNYYFFETDDN